MLEIGLFHNGASSLPVITNKDGVTFNDGSLPEVHRAAQETWSTRCAKGFLPKSSGSSRSGLPSTIFSPRARR